MQDRVRDRMHATTHRQQVDWASKFLTVPMQVSVVQALPPALQMAVAWTSSRSSVDRLHVHFIIERKC